MDKKLAKRFDSFQQKKKKYAVKDQEKNVGPEEQVPGKGKKSKRPRDAPTPEQAEIASGNEAGGSSMPVPPSPLKTADAGASGPRAQGIEPEGPEFIQVLSEGSDGDDEPLAKKGKKQKAPQGKEIVPPFLFLSFFFFFFLTPRSFA